MGIATGYTADHMDAIQAMCVTGGSVDAAGNLTLTRYDGSKITAGKFTGPTGPAGPTGPMGTGYQATALSTQDLNTVTTPGVYTQLTSANATAASNYPLISSGMLEVFSNNSTTPTVVWQRYYPYGPTSTGVDNTMVYMRSYGNSTWSPWHRYNKPLYAKAPTLPTNVVAFLGGYAAPSYTINNDGLLIASGLLKVNAAFAASDLVATFPAPVQNLSGAANGIQPFGLMGGGNTNTPMRCDLQVDGRLILGVGASLASGTLLSLSGLSYYTAPV